MRSITAHKAHRFNKGPERFPPSRRRNSTFGVERIEIWEGILLP
jgi:hypothetical protein